MHLCSMHVCMPSCLSAILHGCIHSRLAQCLGPLVHTIEKVILPVSCIVILLAMGISLSLAMELVVPLYLFLCCNLIGQFDFQYVEQLDIGFPQYIALCSYDPLFMFMFMFYNTI